MHSPQHTTLFFQQLMLNYMWNMISDSPLTHNWASHSAFNSRCAIYFADTGRSYNVEKLNTFTSSPVESLSTVGSLDIASAFTCSAEYWNDTQCHNCKPSVLMPNNSPEELPKFVLLFLVSSRGLSSVISVNFHLEIWWKFFMLNLSILFLGFCQHARCKGYGDFFYIFNNIRWCVTFLYMGWLPS